MRRTLFGLIAGIAIGITLISMSGIGRASDEGSSNALTSWTPDIKQIMNDAMQDIFITAGTEIQDPELASFYDTLTGNVMTNIVAGNGAAHAGPEVAYPLIRIVTPAYNTTVSGVVLISVDAVNDFDPIGSLSVEILIDGATTIEANYQLQSGYYEAMWDSTTVPAGTVHTILLPRPIRLELPNRHFLLCLLSELEYDPNDRCDDRTEYS